jgi:prevent-host-death family protein
MAKVVPASDAKNNFGGLLESVAALGRVDIVRHGRPVAIVLSVREFQVLIEAARSAAPSAPAVNKHMIPAHLARRARMSRPPVDFDED